MTFLSTKNYKLDCMPLPARTSVFDFLGEDEDTPLRTACKTFLHAEKAKKSSIDPDLLSVDEVVQRVIAYTKRASLSYKNEYRKFEKMLRRIKELRKQEPTYLQGKYSYEALGGLDVLMGLKEIEVYVQKKFDDLRKKGILLYQSEFETQENPEKFRKPGRGGAVQSLDRLWGAEYLREKLKDKENYKVPRFFIVIKDHIKTLPIELWNFDPRYLRIKSIETPNAELLVENITPSIPVARNFCHRWMTGIGYVDYSDPGNILRGEDGNYYVVDTEWKSLEGCKYLRQDKNMTAVKFREYIQDRFLTFNPLNNNINIELHK